MGTLTDRLKRLEAGSTQGKAARWRAEMDRREQSMADARSKLAALLERKLAERGIDPDHLPPETPEEHAQSKRELLSALRERLGYGTY